MEKKKDYTLLILICIILLCVLSLFYLYNDKDNNSKEDKRDNYVLLKDYSRFFTINSCIYKYFSYLSNKDTDSLLKVLDSNYLLENNINSDNIYTKTLDLNSYYSFISKKIYYKKLDNYYIEYFVYGYTEEENNYESVKDYYYFKVVFDENNSTFNIAPINSELFKEVSNE